MNNLVYHWYSELRRRKVFRAALAYAASAWLLLQVTEIVAGAFVLPEWTTRLVLILLLLGCPVVLVVAWMFDAGPSGMIRTGDSSGELHWLGAVLWMHQKPLVDDIGNRGSRPRAALERRTLVIPSLWRQWQAMDGQMVFNSTRRAMLAADDLREFSESEGIPLSFGLAVGSVVQVHDTLQGEAAQVACALAHATPEFQIRGTEQVHDELIGEPELGGDFVGRLTVPELSHPVRAYRLDWQRNAEGADRRQGKPHDRRRSRNRRAMWLGGGSLIAIAALAWSLGLRPDSEVALPDLSLEPAVGTYIELKAVADPERRLSEAQNHGLRAALLRVFDRLPAVYPADPDSGAASSLVLDSGLKQNATGWALELRLITTDGSQPVRQVGVQAETLQALFDKTQDAALNLMALRLNLQPRTMEHPESLPIKLYDDLLDAWFVLHQVPGRDQLDRLEELLAPYRSAGENSLLFHTTYCSVLISRVQMLMDGAVLERAAPSCERIAESTEPGVEARLVFTRYLLLRGREREAIQQLGRALQLNPRNADAHDLLAKIYMDQGNPLLAEYTLVKAITMQPGYWRPLRSLALFQFNAGRYEDAALTYRRLIELAPNNGRAWSDLGAAHFMAGNFAPAADAFNRAVQLEPSQAGYSNLGTLYYYLGRYGDAVRNYELALKQAPSDFRLYGNLGDVYRVQGNAKQAQHYYSLALQKIDEYLQNASENIDTRGLRILYAFHRGQLPSAYADMLALIEQAPANAELEMLAAILAKTQADRQQVLQHLRRAVQLGFSTNIISVDPDFAYLGSDTAFTRLITSQGP